MIFGVTSMETLIYKGLRVFLRVVLAIFEYKKSVESLIFQASTEVSIEVNFTFGSVILGQSMDVEQICPFGKIGMIPKM